MITPKLSEPHDWHSVEYVDDWVTSYHTRDKERLSRLQMLAGLIPFGRGEAIRVLDVGAGYGFLSQVVLEAFPNARVTCHDYSEPMLAQARERLKDYASQVFWVKGDLSSPDWTQDLDGPFDAIVSSIAIHNVRLPERIRAIYSELFPLVKRGGCFLNIDHMSPAGDVTGRLYRQARLADKQRSLKEQQGIEKSLEELIKEEDEEHAQAGRSRNGPGATSLEAQLLWLHEAGFAEVECFWKEMGQVIIGGYRSPE